VIVVAACKRRRQALHIRDTTFDVVGVLIALTVVELLHQLCRSIAQVQRNWLGGGSLNVFSATLNPIVHVAPHGPVDVYFTGGGGLYRQNRDFTQPGITRGVGFDPFFGFYPYAAPVDVVVSSYSVVKPGIDAGMGVAFGSKWGGKFFGEARYNRIFLGNRHTDYVPVTFGFRW